MDRPAAIGLAALLALLSSGCIPAPHRNVLIPALDGVVLDDGQPVAGAGIEVSHGPARPARYQAVATTDAAGRFSYPGKKETRFFLPLLGDRMFAWSLNIRSNGRVVTGFDDWRLGGVPALLRLACELQRAGNDLACRPVTDVAGAATTAR